MKPLTKTMLMMATIALFSLMSAPALAFHNGGVAECNGCHTMHNGPSNQASNAGGNDFLLLDAKSTDTCLRCHAENSLGNVWGASLTSPGKTIGGGQFIFLTAAGLNDGFGAATDLPGDRAGHNVLSDTYAIGPDAQNTSSPGGAYPSNKLTCTSCHDPHGRHSTAVGSHFRLLLGNDGVNSTGSSNSMGYAFNYSVSAPVANGTGIFGGGENYATQTGHTAYRSGMAEWCGTCHGDYHTGAVSLVHPAGQTLGTTIANNYNNYNGTGFVNGTQATAYIIEVPFEDTNTAVYDTNTTVGPTGSSKVMCLTCHRAHASSGPWSGRWDFNIATIGPNVEGVKSGTYAIPNPYQATAGNGQRSLCNKCHIQDPGL